MQRVSGLTIWLFICDIQPMFKYISAIYGETADKSSDKTV
jgi:hypothetical protein